MTLFFFALYSGEIALNWTDDNEVNEKHVYEDFVRTLQFVKCSVMMLHAGYKFTTHLKIGLFLLALRNLFGGGEKGSKTKTAKKLPIVSDEDEDDK